MADHTAVGPDLTEVFGPDLLTQGLREKLRKLVGLPGAPLRLDHSEG
ncbi:MAG: hypothetical protein ONB23_13450 [candidate division KSB1 bacterium]|nr:hypothetical protein [candidate division KSB1 bacterium]